MKKQITLLSTLIIVILLCIFIGCGKEKKEVTLNDETTMVMSYDVGEEKELPVLNKDGYTFLGWFLNDQTKKEKITKEDNLDFELFAKWEKINYTITYDLNKGVWAEVPCANIEEVKEAFFEDYYEFIGNSFSKEMFIGDINNTKTGRWYINYKSRLFENNNLEECYVGSSNYFLNDSRYYKKWLAFFKALEEATSDTFFTDSKKAADILVNFFDKKMNDKEEQILQASKKQQVIKTSFTIDELPLALPKVSNGLVSFLGWYEKDKEVTLIDKPQNYTLSAKWEDAILPESIEVENIDYVTLGENKKINYQVLPLGNLNTEVRFISDNINVLEFKDGMIYPVGYGKAHIHIVSVYDSTIRFEKEIFVIPDTNEDMIIFTPYDGLDNYVIKNGEKIDVECGYMAYSKENGEMTTSVKNINNIDYNKDGEYEIKYYIEETNASLTKKVTINTLLYAAHRGAKFGGVENTLEAFNMAIDKGYDAIETDVKVTKDNVLVCWHDDSFNSQGRYTVDDKYLNYKIAEHTYDEIKDIEITQMVNGKIYKGKLCLLDDYLSLCKENNIIPLIEAKSGTGMTNTNFTKAYMLIDAIKKYDLQDIAYVISMNEKLLTYIKEELKYDRVQFVCSDNFGNLKSYVLLHKLNISLKWEYMTKEIIDEFHNHGLIVNTWTIYATSQSKKRISDFMKWGMDYITTDDMLSLDSIIKD